MEQLDVRILDRDYRLSCEAAERERLLAAVAELDGRMQAIRDQRRVAGADRIAVLAALQIASERQPVTAVASVAKNATSDAVADDEILRRMQSINALLDTALADQERLF